MGSTTDYVSTSWPMPGSEEAHAIWAAYQRDLDLEDEMRSFALDIEMADRAMSIDDHMEEASYDA